MIGGAARIGQSVVIKEKLTASEDLCIEGSVDGRIELKENALTIGPEGRIKAEILATSTIVHGPVVGNITATERIDISRGRGARRQSVRAPHFHRRERALPGTGRHEEAHDSLSGVS